MAANKEAVLSSITKMIKRIYTAESSFFNSKLTMPIESVPDEYKILYQDIAIDIDKIGNLLAYYHYQINLSFQSVNGLKRGGFSTYFFSQLSYYAKEILLIVELLNLIGYPIRLIRYQDEIKRVKKIKLSNICKYEPIFDMSEDSQITNIENIKKIKELEKMILDSDIKLSVILQHALIVAHEHDNDSVPWIKQEMNGYQEGKKCPEYRKVSGNPKGKDHYGNWQPYIIENNKDQNAISRLFVGTSALSLENTIEDNPTKNSGIFHFHYPSEWQKKLAVEGAIQFALEVQLHSIVSILDNIRAELLNWVIDLSKKENPNSDTASSNIIFPQNLISRLPKNLQVLANDFNFNFSHDKADACMLILRRMLPLSIVEKFQENGQEKTIKKGNDYLDTMPLLAKAEHLITKRRYKEIISYKKFLDASQHSYTFSPEISDVLQVATTLRLLLDELFLNKDNKNQ